MTIPLPVPLLLLVIVSQLESLVAVQPQESVVTSATLPLPPAAAMFSLVGVAHVTKDMKVRTGADLHLIVPVAKVISLYSTLGYGRLEINGEQTSGFSVLVGISPSFLYAK